jgi:histidyl-tRNA synthetase
MKPYYPIIEDTEVLICAGCGNMIDVDNDDYTFADNGDPLCDQCYDLLP